MEAHSRRCSLLQTDEEYELLILMKVTFGITVHNETDSLRSLLDQLLEFIESQEDSDEIVILDDYSTNSDTITILDEVSENPNVTVYSRSLDRDFGAQKTYMNSLCKGEYIFQLDADELVAPQLLENLHEILNANPEIELIWLPRVNTVEGLTEEHIQLWGWKVSSEGWVMWPDYQGRIYKNLPRIMWTGKVHERITGHLTYTFIPAQPELAILHHKSIARQEQQNSFYSQIQGSE